MGGTVPDAVTDKASREKAIAAALAHSGYQPAPGHLRAQVEAPPPQATTWQEVEKSLKEHKTLLRLLKQEEELALVAATVLPPQEVAIPEEARACYTYYQETLRYQDALLVDGVSQEDALSSYTALISSFRKESS